MRNTIHTASPRRGRSSKKSTGPAAFLTAGEVADRLGVSTQALANWRARDSGPLSIKVMGSVRYPLAEFEQWLERETTASARGGV